MTPVCKHPRGFRASSALRSPPLGTNGFPCGAVGLDKLMDPGTSSTGYSHLHRVLAGHADMVVSMNGGPQYRSQNTTIHHVLGTPKWYQQFSETPAPAPFCTHVWALDGCRTLKPAVKVHLPVLCGAQTGITLQVASVGSYWYLVGNKGIFI